MASTKGSRVLRVLKALDAHPIIGISVKELSEGLEISAVHVVRDLEDLVSEGLAVKLDNGNYAYSIAMLQIAERFRQHHERITERLQEVENRIHVKNF